jgi:hypothetical protein
MLKPLRLAIKKTKLIDGEIPRPLEVVHILQLWKSWFKLEPGMG